MKASVYCFKCRGKKESEMVESFSDHKKSPGRKVRMLSGSCPDCGGKVFRALGTVRGDPIQTRVE